MNLIAYQLYESSPVQIRPATPMREWMDATQKHFAYICLPLVMANRGGWELINPVDFSAVWDGGADVTSTEIQHDEGFKPIASSHFGSGILTFHTGFVFRTDPGYNLHVRGIPNLPKDGVFPLEGIVESDWLAFTFTMNWKITRANKVVTFRAGEPFCFISPTPRGLLESVNPVLRDIREDEAMSRDFEAWSSHRRRFLVARMNGNSDESKLGWSRDYLKGQTPWGEQFPDHQTRLAVAPFVREATE